MRTTLNLDAALVKKAQKYTGITQKTALIHRALQSLIEQEAMRRLADMSGTMPDLKVPARRRMAS